jgi:transcriptional regulator with XRE-family HTH domain
MTRHYTGCNYTASPNLHPVAFYALGRGATLCCMERKHNNYVKEWRQKRELTQKELVDRLILLAGDHRPDDPALRIPTTEASLSRIENGKQNFSIGTLEAIAAALDVDEPGWLLDRNPLKEGEVVDLWDYKLSTEQRVQARAVLDAMFGKA